MILLTSDYCEGAHPSILKAMCDTNLDQMPGYGMDSVCEGAREKIKAACEAPNADVHFLVGGTQANLTVIASILRPFEGALCAASGHINVHETGSIEATGHKVLPLDHKQGKIEAWQVKAYVDAHRADEAFEHTVKPGMVYISQPTEYGTLYSKAELTALYDVCREYELPLFVDGARLGYGLVAKENDVTLPDLAKLCDVFYIGGTKVGALFGEAVVILNDKYKKDFRYAIKQRGGMLAKGWLLGRQFDALFTDGLYTEISKNAVDLANKIKDALIAKGIPLYYNSPTNQQFCVLTEQQLEKLGKKYVFSDNGPVEGGRLMRICTSWATKPENVESLVEDIAAL